MKKSRLKFICKVHTGGTPKSSEEDFWGNDLIWYTPEDIGKNNKVLIDSKRKITYSGSDKSSAKIIKAPAVVMTTRAPVGNLGISYTDFTTNQGCKSLTLLKNGNINYIYYQFTLMRDWLNVISTGTTFLELSTSKLKDVNIYYPSVELQNIICFYLNVKLSDIDSLISLKEKQIKLLEEQHQAMRTEAVTKGLNPNVKMKDSGVEWIGEIPEDWKVTKIKYIANQIIDGTHTTPNYLDSGVPFLRVTDITKSKNKEINMDGLKFISEQEHQELIRRCNPQKGDLLISKNGTIGVPKVINWNWEFSIFVSLCLIKLKNSVMTDFIFFIFKSFLVEEQILQGQKKNTINNLHLEKIKEFYIFLPDFEEQKNICVFLSKKDKEYDELLDKITVQISKLKEYRQSLIHEAVTGKISTEEMESYLKEAEKDGN